MIECIFTIDYEIYGNGEGSLENLVLNPTNRLKSIFDQAECKFVNFVEVAELELIDKHQSDPAIHAVKQQIKTLAEEGFEIGLHIHPQWYNAAYKENHWCLDNNEYNLCTLSSKRINELVEKALRYLRVILEQPNFTPLSFRAGNWLMQPSKELAIALVKCGIELDSSLFKGGLQHRHGLDYRKALDNGYYWNFSDDINIPNPEGKLLEIPTYSKMVPFWQMLTPKRVGIKPKTTSSTKLSGPTSLSNKLQRYLDFIRFKYPLKFDFCRMTLTELTTMIDSIVEEDNKTPSQFKPIVAIGHSKDLDDFDTVAEFLAYLKVKQIPVSTFGDVFPRCTVTPSL